MHLKLLYKTVFLLVSQEYLYCYKIIQSLLHLFKCWLKQRSHKDRNSGQIIHF